MAVASSATRGVLTLPAVATVTGAPQLPEPLWYLEARSRKLELVSRSVHTATASPLGLTAAAGSEPSELSWVAVSHSQVLVIALKRATRIAAMVVLPLACRHIWKALPAASPSIRNDEKAASSPAGALATTPVQAGCPAPGSALDSRIADVTLAVRNARRTLRVSHEDCMS